MDFEDTNDSVIPYHEILDYNVDDAQTYNISLDLSSNQTETRDLNIPVYIYTYVSVINIAIFLVGTIGNILVILVVLRVRDMRTPTNVFLLNLSLADVLVLGVCQPAAMLEFFGKDRWFLGKFMCEYYIPTHQLFCRVN